MVNTRILITLVACALAPACSDSDNNVIIGDPVGDTVLDGEARGEDIAATADFDFAGDDYLTVIGKTASMLAAINNGEISQSTFAVQVLFEADILDFADLMVIDHTDANAALELVVRSYGVGYIPNDAEQMLIGDANAGLADLRQSGPGQVDFVYTQLQVINHASALVVLDELAAVVGPGAMGTYIADTRVMMEDHLGVSTALLDTFY